VLTQEPTRPQGVPADLSTIVLKALKKAPADRYATANAMAADLQRWLHGEPVLAQRDSFSCCTHRFVGRHRLPVALASSALTPLIVGTGVAVWQAREAAGQHDHALQLLARSEALLEQLMPVLMPRLRTAAERDPHATTTSPGLSAYIACTCAARRRSTAAWLM
jgi:eukaryotic-like serine/threonine-protein kinase